MSLNSFTWRSRHWVALCAFLVSGCTTDTSRESSITTGGDYVINVASSPGTGNGWRISKEPVFNDKKFHVIRVNYKGRQWERLRVGFFQSSKNAKQFLPRVKKIYPGAWIGKSGNFQQFSIFAGATAKLLVAARQPSVTSKKPASRKITPVKSSSILHGKYSIILASSPGTGNSWKISSRKTFRGKRFYVTRTNIKNKLWERLNLGFYPAFRDAKKVLPTIRKTYPGAWIKRTEKTTRYSVVAGRTSAPLTGLASTVSTIATTTIASPALKKPHPVTFKPRKSADEYPEDLRLKKTFDRGKTAMVNKQFSKAIRLFTAISRQPANRYSQDSLELLGLARHRNGQKAHAAAQYKKYLAFYPDTEGAVRVNQRLAGLLTETSRPADGPGLETRKPVAWEKFGSLSQYYQYVEDSIDGIGSVTSVSQLLSNFDITAINRGTKWDSRLQLTADHTLDFLDSEDNNDFRFTEMYYDATHLASGISTRAGRQTIRIGGLRGRLDALLAGYQVLPKARLNVFAGAPVETTDNSGFNSHKKTFGYTVETGTFYDSLDLNVYQITQSVDGIDDRDAVGFELRYFDGNKSFFGMLDYDSSFQEFNIIQFNGNLRLNNGSSLQLNTFIRKTPLLTTSNALIGQLVDSIDELKMTFSEDQIRQFARDRTADSFTVTLSGSHPLTKKYQVSGDITVSTVSDTPASGGVAATPGTGNDYFYSARIIGNNLIYDRDTHVLEMRFIDTRPTDTLSIISNSRFFLSRNWRINPRLQFDIRNNTGGRQDKLRGVIRTDYRHSRRVRFDAEIGYDITNEKTAAQSLGSNSFFATLGYRWDF